MKKLLNCKELAAAVGRKPAYISAAKAAGYEMLYTTQTTLEHFLDWRRRTGFVMTSYVKQHSKAKPRRRATALSPRCAAAPA